MSSRLADILLGLQEHFEGELRGGRSALDHPVARGDASEDGWLRILQEHLPRRYQADRAFVIDATGACSDQIDIVVYDRQYSPLLYHRSSQRFIPAESVYAILEVKQDLNREHILYAGDKASSVRQLSRTSAPIYWLQGPDRPRSLPRIIAGILTYRSSWNPAFGKPLGEILSELRTEAQIDIGCSLMNGVFEATYSPGSPAAVRVTEDKCSLVQFLMRLLKQLQALATVPAIDYGAYLARFERAGSK